MDGVQLTLTIPAPWVASSWGDAGGAGRRSVMFWVRVRPWLSVKLTRITFSLRVSSVRRKAVLPVTSWIGAARPICTVPLPMRMSGSKDEMLACSPSAAPVP